MVLYLKYNQQELILCSERAHTTERDSINLIIEPTLEDFVGEKLSTASPYLQKCVAHAVGATTLMLKNCAALNFFDSKVELEKYLTMEALHYMAKSSDKVVLLRQVGTPRYSWNSPWKLASHTYEYIEDEVVSDEDERGRKMWNYLEYFWDFIENDFRELLQIEKPLNLLVIYEGEEELVHDCLIEKIIKKLN